jgi:hypothetical protein
MEETMKCIKNVETGNIIRVDEKQAYQMAGRTWKYVPKSEWKLVRGVIETPTEQQIEQTEKGEETKAKKAEKRSKLKEKQRPEEGIDSFLKK